MSSNYFFLLFIMLQLDIGVSKASLNSSKIENLITSICMSNFKNAMNQAGKTAPIGMGEFTCDCFLDKINIGSSFNKAKMYCKEEAEKKFNP